ncbi:biotin carboxylase [Hydrogenophaga sp. A37]|uniref:biotin carboxylase n=1 Tax=Hydrogenophaga sp. A37 TaxID=1945864 RepID=UPI000986183B|nr:biotin carboxylase [Hydrogenophaga sp. A37]OOG79507.1 biotin carboxylase [Hydrogenophaga sp. A37]
MSTIVKNISDLLLMLHRNERPIYFVSATNFNLLGMDRWVNRFRAINYIDCFDGRHPNVFVPSETPHEEFSSIEDITNHLLQHKEVIDMIERRGGKPVGTFLMFDEKTEELAKELKMDIWFPPAKLRQRCDNKMETVRIGNKAGVLSVPNALEKVNSFAHLMQIAERHGLGRDLVVQSAFGDSGHTTFFISNEAEFDKHKDEIINDPEVKIMKRINCRGATLEACATQSGTLVGPLLTEVVGAKELTPYKGGWCGNEVFPGAFSDGVRAKARDMAERFGNQLLAEGYRGYFDLDFLIDQDNGEVYLGELNPRICGASPMTNHAAFAYADAPLFLFHLLEFSGVPFDLNVKELNERWAQPHFIDNWSQVVIKFTEDRVDQVTRAPATGIYRMGEDGSVAYQRFDYNRKAIDSEREAFFQRITGPGDFRYEGADLGILITRGRSMDDDFKLNLRARDWIKGIKQHYDGKPIVTTEHAYAPAPGSFKIL